MSYIEVTIIGGGNVGAEVALLLLHHTRPLRINIIEPDNNRSGALLDISHICGSNSQHYVVVNNEELISSSDFIFYCAGFCNNPGESRLAVAERNIQLTYDIFKDLKFDKKPNVIVVTNPVDIICSAVMRVFNDKAFIVSTGTLLDTIRLNYYTALEFGCSFDQAEGWVLGEHGDSMVPVFSQTRIKGKPIFEVAYLKQLDTIAANTVKAAATIRITEEGTRFGVAHCAYRIFQCILNKDSTATPIGVKINEHYKKLLRVEEDIFLGLPAKLNNKEFVPDNQFKLNAMELELLQHSARIISDNYIKFIKPSVN